MKKFVAGHETTSSNHKPNDNANYTHDGGEHHELADDLNTMMSTMVSKIFTRNADKDYVTLMLAHHQNAVSLSEDKVTHVHHTELKNTVKNNDS